jgi:hypothetical protein
MFYYRRNPQATQHIRCAEALLAIRSIVGDSDVAAQLHLREQERVCEEERELIGRREEESWGRWRKITNFYKGDVVDLIDVDADQVSDFELLSPWRLYGIMFQCFGVAQRHGSGSHEYSCAIEEMVHEAESLVAYYYSDIDVGTHLMDRPWNNFGRASFFHANTHTPISKSLISLCEEMYG